MHQVAASVWNEIAKSQELRNPSFRLLMAMPQDKMTEALASQADALEKSGTPISVINAYQEIAPLLAEHQAISSYINQTGNSDLREAMPEVLSAPEAVAIASLERPLSRSEQATLLQMLQPLTPAISNAA
jgi:hypothetical protein